MIDVGIGYPVLAVPRKNQEEQRDSQGLPFGIGPYGSERPPGRQRQGKAQEQSQGLPQKRIWREQAGGPEEDRAEKGTEGLKGREEFSRPQEVCDPGERPVIPVETGPWEHQAVS